MAAYWPIADLYQDDQVIATRDNAESTDFILAFQKGAIFEVLERKENGWLWARNVKTMEIGYIFDAYFKKYIVLSQEEWYFGNISLKTAKDLLSDESNSKGDFLIIAMDSQLFNFVLMVKHNSDDDEANFRYRCFRIIRGRSKDGSHIYYFRINKKVTYSSLSELVSVHLKSKSRKPRLHRCCSKIKHTCQPFNGVELDLVV